MKFILRDTLYLTLFLSLSGCSLLTHTSTFHNRSLDYTQENLKTTPNLSTPSNLSQPVLTPSFPIPPGPGEYPPGNPPIITPPGFSTEIPVPEHPLPFQNNASSS